MSARGSASLFDGDPVRLPCRAENVAALIRALDLPDLDARAFPMVPGVALVRVRGAGIASSLRWVHLPDEATLSPDTGPVTDVLLLRLSPRDAGRALRRVAELRRRLTAPGMLPALRAAESHEALERALEGDGEPGEVPLDSDELLAILGSGRDGLEDHEVVRRRALAGENRIERTPHPHAILRVLSQFWSPFALVLWVGGVLAIVAGMPQLGWAIFVVIVVNGLFGYLQEHRAERAVEALARLLPPTIRVVRGGREERLPVSDLVPGDIVHLEEGDQVPADGQTIAAEGLQVDQGALTGESWPVDKRPRAGHAHPLPHLEQPACLFAATSVVAGAGTMVVTATGMATEIGRIARLTQGVAAEPSPLRLEMARLTRRVALLAVSFGVVFLAIGTLTGAMALDRGLLFALGVIVATVPEGLLPTLTLALALGAQRLARRGSLVKRLSAIEGLGATTVICTDKTGTLTENRMVVRSVWADGVTYEAALLERDRPAWARELFEAATLASRASMFHGDPTETALIRQGAALGVDPEVTRRLCPLRASYPFDSFRKRMTHVCDGPQGAVAFVKGAPAEILSRCSAAWREGRAAPMDEAQRRECVMQHDRMAAEGLRMLAVARRSLPGFDAGHPAADVERELVFLGMVGLWDPPRPELPEAIATCGRAGVRVIMVTGDHGLTAQAIAARIGLAARRVVTGAEIDGLSSNALDALVAEPGVLFARVSPTHKLAIVRALEARGEVVAVTGDGVNDAPALKAASIGVAMGRGSDVAKEAAAVVITDDDLSSIVAAIRQGRAVYDNMGKFITYIFTSNVSELAPFLCFVFLGVPLPLTVMQILAVDLATDMVPALALGAEPPEPGIMERPPRPRAARLLTAARLWHVYAFLGLAEAVLAMLAFFWTYWNAGWRPPMPMAADGDLYHRATTMTLAGIVAAQIGNVFACRTERQSVFAAGLFRNRLVLQGVAAEIAILLALILVPGLARVFGLAPLAFSEWWVLLLFPPAMLGLEELRKWWMRRAPRAGRPTVTPLPGWQATASVAEAGPPGDPGGHVPAAT